MIIISLVAVLLTSCEDIAGGAGVVLAAHDRTPIEEVMVVLYLDDVPVDTVFSNDGGHFNSRILVGCVPKCPENKLVFQKAEFRSKSILFDEQLRNRADFYHYRDSMVVLLHRVED